MTNSVMLGSAMIVVDFRVIRLRDFRDLVGKTSILTSVVVILVIFSRVFSVVDAKLVAKNVVVMLKYVWI